MALDVLLGLQWGDEGKGKIVDFLASRYHAIVRFQGGPNAGHTIVIGDKKFVLHTIPSGIFHANLLNVIGNGVVVDAAVLHQECMSVSAQGVDVVKHLLLSKKAHFITPTHKLLDKVSEAKRGNSKIGSTLKGIGPAYMDKTGRNGLRLGDMHSADFDKKYQALKAKHLEIVGDYEVDFDLVGEEKKWFAGVEYLRQLNCIDSEFWIDDMLNQGKNILAEGAQGTMLDIDFGTYPYVTSSNTITGGVCSGIGIAPTRIRHVIGITKAYCTRVGSGPFPTELENEIGENLRKIGNEYGSTTGRNRRCGWLDLVALKYACMINGVTHLVVTKNDVLNDFDTIKIAVSYKHKDEEVQQFPYDLMLEEYLPVYKDFTGWHKSLDGCKDFDDLPMDLQIYLKYIEKELNIPIFTISTGVERNQLIVIE